MNPDAEIIVYIYTPLPAQQRARCAAPRTLAPLLDVHGEPVVFPAHAGGMDRAPLGGLCLPRRRAVAERATAAAHPATSSPCCAAAFRPCRTRARRAGRKAALRASRPGAIRCAATTGRGSSRLRSISIGLLDPRVVEHLTGACLARRCRSASSSTRSGARRRHAAATGIRSRDIADRRRAEPACASRSCRPAGARRQIARNGVDFHFLPPDSASGLAHPQRAHSRGAARLGARRVSRAWPGVRARGARAARARAERADLSCRIMPTACRASGGAARGAAALRSPTVIAFARARRRSRSAGAVCCRRERAPYSRSPSPRAVSCPAIALRRAPPPDCTAIRRVLWVGHLDRNKDPLTVLEGVGAAARHLPGLQLWCCFGSAPLLASRAGAHRRRTRGCAIACTCWAECRMSRSRQLMRAADLFVLGSHREGSSFSLIEALATGLTPVVTDIPSLRVLTGNGAVGALWPCGDAHACADALVRAAQSLQPGTRDGACASSTRTCRIRAIGRRFAEAYGRIHGGAQRRRRRPDMNAARQPLVSVVMATLQSRALPRARNRLGAQAEHRRPRTDHRRRWFGRAHAPGAARLGIRSAGARDVAAASSASPARCATPPCMRRAADTWPSRTPMTCGCRTSWPASSRRSRRPGARWCYTACEHIDSRGAPIAPGHISAWRAHDGDIRDAVACLRAHTALPTVLVERELLDQAGFFDERMTLFEDHDLWLRLACLSEVAVVPRPLVKVRRHDEHYSGRDELAAAECRATFLERAWRAPVSAAARAELRRIRALHDGRMARLRARAGDRRAALASLRRRCATDGATHAGGSTRRMYS